ncbi:DUF3987 domain-containing protein [Desulfolutivibrio sulfoxidireducens]|uniref:DUF3987 domain-containing protein n=1 Tax=Desulfolutivibrio sulfoxidireducens TaxID=2773299 RepID=UPI00159EB21E|nr:DUF3987 domain-containing protein [Desulfolutivibrio sulfoxidireducens]QLA21249.1 DUF3987 domain-containing protein [Desulfolutivibrio sulfoxidireducens]
MTINLNGAGPQGRAKSNNSAADPVRDFEAVLHEHGLVVDQVIPDGALHRCGTSGKERGKDGAYTYHPDHPASGWYQNYRTGDVGNWTSTDGARLTPEERAAMKGRVERDRAARQAEEARRHAEARDKAKAIYEACPPCPADHPYLTKKGVAPVDGLRLARDGRIVMPVLDEHGEIISLQFIGHAPGKDRDKDFLAGGQVAGGYFVVKGGKDPLYIAEGLATGLTVHEATGQSVLVAFNCGNLKAVASMAREKYPAREIIIAADNDHKTDGNPGVTKATEAARAVKGKVVVPRFVDPSTGTDFNDLATAEGVEVVKAQLAEAREPDPEVVADQPDWPAPIPFDEHLPPPIPPDLIPGVIKGFALAVAESIQVPFELALCSALGALAVAAQRKFRIEVKDGYSEGLNIYALCPLPPGERKSSTVEECKRPLVEWQKQARMEAAEHIQAAESERKTLEKVIESKRTAAARAKTPEARREAIEEIKALERELPEVAAWPRLLADDFTPEALGALMEKCGERIGLLEAEGGIFDTLAGRYSNGVPNLDAVLKFWSGESCQIDRRGREAVYLDNPHLTLVISPQPDVVRGLADKPGFRGRGLIGRFLYFMPQSRLGYRRGETSPIPWAIADAWKATVSRILSLPWTVGEHGKDTAHVVSLEPGAYAQWKEFAGAVETELRPGGEFEHMTDWAGKFPGQAVRLAGLFHVAVDPEPHRHPLAGDTMRAALLVAGILAEHAKAAYSLMGSNPAMECARSILRWIVRDHVERFTGRDALRIVRGRFSTMEMVNPGLALLEERAFIRQTDAASRNGPGRKPSAVYVVNPLTWR